MVRLTLVVTLLGFDRVTSNTAKPALSAAKAGDTAKVGTASSLVIVATPVALALTVAPATLLAIRLKVSLGS